MLDGKGWQNRLAQQMDLWGEPMPGIPIVELAGDNRVLIERHKGIVEYGPCTIGVKVSYGQISVCGSNLELICITREQLVIAGCIDHIQVYRRR